MCLVSEDLENFSQEIVVYAPPADFHGIGDLFWAPECHYYKGNFYIFTSVRSSKTGKHLISVYRADNPLGPFEDIAGGGITPYEWDCIDGTLYIDKLGEPYMIFVHEWVSMPDKNGSFVYAKLSEDFTHFVTAPKHMFFARDVEWARHGVTDGAYPFVLDSGRLGLIWSNFSENGYVVATAYSKNGTLNGPWIHAENPLYERNARPEFTYDGGHGMLFLKKDGKFALALHSPNDSSVAYERVTLFEVAETENEILLK